MPYGEVGFLERQIVFPTACEGVASVVKGGMCSCQSCGGASGALGSSISQNAGYQPRRNTSWRWGADELPLGGWTTGATLLRFRPLPGPVCRPHGRGVLTPSSRSHGRSFLRDPLKHGDQEGRCAMERLGVYGAETESTGGRTAPIFRRAPWSRDAGARKETESGARAARCSRRNTVRCTNETTKVVGCGVRGKQRGTRTQEEGSVLHGRSECEERPIWGNRSSRSRLRTK